MNACLKPIPLSRPDDDTCANLWKGCRLLCPPPPPGKLKLFTHKIKVPKVGSEPLLAPHPHEKLLNLCM